MSAPPRVADRAAGPAESSAAPAGAGPAGGATAAGRRPQRFRRPAAVVAGAAVAVALVGLLAIWLLRSGGTPPATTAGSALVSPASAGSPSTCTAAIDAANRSVDEGKQVQAAFAEHAHVMHQADAGQLTAQQAFTMGMPALTNGAGASAQFDQLLDGYHKAAANCGPAASAVCRSAVTGADEALGHAQQIEAALREYTDIMNQLNYGKITGAQAMTQGMASLSKGETESTQFDQALARYQQAAAGCR